MAQQFVQAQKFFLSGSGATSAATSITLQTMKTPDGTKVLTADLGTTAYGTLEPGTTREEIISFTTVTQNADGTATITGVTRGLGFISPYTTVTANKLSHAGNTEFVMSNNPQLYVDLISFNQDETITGTWTFTNPEFPRMDTAATAPTDDPQLATKKYVDDIASGGTASNNRLIVSATAGETVAAGEVLYLDETDNEWKKADASVSATSDNQQLGIAQGAGTNGATIAGGVLIYGRDSNQSGLTQGDKLFISDTAGAVASSAGTVEVEIGHAVTATSLDFIPKYASFTTKDQRTDLATITGATSGDIFYSDGADLKAAAFATDGQILYSATQVPTPLAIGTASQVLKVNAGATAPEWVDTAFFGGDGSDGALDTSGGTVNIDISSANLVVKNYTSINVVTNNLTFTNPASDGTIVILRSQGSVTISASIVASSLGADAGAAGGEDADGTAGTDAFAILDSAGHTADLGNSGTNSGTGGAVATVWELAFLYPDTDDELHRRVLNMGPASGGGGGGGGVGDAGGTGGVGAAGGKGGGAILIESGGALNFTGTITVAGAAGAAGGNGTAGAGGAGGGAGGGGGSGGHIIILYNTLTSAAGTSTVTGGGGGNGGNAAHFGGGGARGGGGGAGGSNFNTASGVGGTGQTGGTNGDNGGTPSGGGTGGTGGTGTGSSGGGGGGGGGSLGKSLVAKNIWFA